MAKKPAPAGLKSRFFGDYEILSELARGGMGIVYRARQLGLNREVALKMVQSNQLLSDEARLRFRVEIEAVAQLHHPHIVSLYDSGEHDGAHYFTMRFVEGGDLAAHLKKERPLRERVQMLVKVCRAVHYAHQRGILHRDLKPSNILLDAQGEPHVADFGLAKSLEQDSGFTFTASVLGSPNYMAPEQAIGKTRQLTTAVDVYGLGAILYHVLAGRPPFQAKTPIATLRQVVDVDPESPRLVNSAIDIDLETIALKCLRKEPVERYGSAEELAQDLERWLNGVPILARPLSWWASAWRWGQKHPVAAVLGIALGLALAAIVWVTASAAVRVNRAERQSAEHLRASLLREASSLRLAGKLGHREHGLRLLREAAALGGSPEFRLRVRSELVATMARTELVFVPLPTSNLAAGLDLMRFDAEFARLATIQNGTNVQIRALGGTTLLSWDVPGTPVSHVEGFSANGRFLALRQTNLLTIWDLESGERCLSHEGTNNIFAFAPHENAVLVQEVVNEAVYRALPSGEERFRWRSEAPRLARRASGWHTFEFSRNGRIVAGASGTSMLTELMNPQTGRPYRLVTNSSHTLSMTFSRYGSALAVSTSGGRVHVWHPASGILRWETPSLISPGRTVAYHPSGDWVALGCDDEQIRIIDAFTERVAFEHTGASAQIAFSPDGKRLGPIRHHGQWGWLEMQAPEEFTDFRFGISGFRLSDGYFSVDGKILAVGHSDRVILCDPVRGTRIQDREDWRMSAFVFHPREQVLFTGETNGIVRYDYRLSSTGEVAFSEGELIHPGAGWRGIELTPDARFFAAYNSQSNAAFVYDRTLTNQLAMLGPDTNAEWIAISPEGRWITLAGRADRSVNVWDVNGGDMVLSRKVGVAPHGRFSGDGRWLVMTGKEAFHLFETGSWKEAPRLPFERERPVIGPAVFSPDSRMLAVVVDRFSVQLVDLHTFTSLGTLRPPGAIELCGLAFSPDGSQLAAMGPESRVAVWQLDRLKRRLAEFGLNWEGAESQ